MTLRRGSKLKSKVDGAELILVTDCAGPLECAGVPLEVIFAPPAARDSGSNEEAD